MVRAPGLRYPGWDGVRRAVQEYRRSVEDTSDPRVLIKEMSRASPLDSAEPDPSTKQVRNGFAGSSAPSSGAKAASKSEALP